VFRRFRICGGFLCKWCRWMVCRELEIRAQDASVNWNLGGSPGCMDAKPDYSACSITILTWWLIKTVWWDWDHSRKWASRLVERFEGKQEPDGVTYRTCLVRETAGKIVWRENERTGTKRENFWSLQTSWIPSVT